MKAKTKNFLLNLLMTIAMALSCVYQLVKYSILVESYGVAGFTLVFIGTLLLLAIFYYNLTE